VTDVRWGILGAGWIVQQATGDALRSAEGASLQVVAARDLDRAQSLGASRADTDYRSVIEANDVDAIYIALSNEAHLPWILAAVEAGKHVVCEKPLTLSPQDTQLAFDAADKAGVLLVEAVWSRWHPRIERIVELCRTGALGDIESFLGTFTFPEVTPGNYRLDAERGGGALLDVGIYPLHVLAACLPEVEFRPTLVEQSGDGGVDLTTRATLEWSNGRASIACSFVMPESQRLVIAGTKQTVTIDDDQAFTSWRAPSSLTIGAHRENFASVDAYQRMFEAVTARIRGDEAWVLPRHESERVAGLVDRIQRWSN
jgi:D-xylose 1-dehydrogenase (NADP+, D-xylono-1,5-lactone-forming)